MPIDPAEAIGARLDDRHFSWTTSDVLLYHLAIGAGSRKGENLSPSALRWTYDGPGMQVLPSFGIVAPGFRNTKPPELAMPGVDIDLSQVVHASQSITVDGPIPVHGSGTVRTRVTDVWDKGNAAVIWQEAVAMSDDGSPLWSARSSIYVRGEGGFGGKRGTLEKVSVPARAHDVETAYAVSPQQALLYRLCGDRNPLHADPVSAQRSGFSGPILHGLCTWGIVLRELTASLLGADATKVRSFSGRFAGIVYPGDTLRIRGWREGDRVLGDVVVTGDAGHRTGAAVLKDVVLVVKD